ncbi:MAG: ABC transporter permease, partial [Desulfobacteraceae bacterium]
MQRYILSRLIQSAAILFGVLFIVFFMLQMTGDPVSLLISRHASPEEVEALREELGFNRPLPVQFIDFVSGAVVGDFGKSLRHQRPAMDLILDRLPATMELAATALLISLILGIPLGLISGSNPGSFWDVLSRGTGLLGQTIPNFWLALILILVFSVQLGWFPTFGRDTWVFLGVTLPTRS